VSAIRILNFEAGGDDVYIYTQTRESIIWGMMRETMWYKERAEDVVGKRLWV
jgi:hypothetical protein